MTTGVIQQAAGWNGGVLLATSTVNEVKVFTSKDGRDWLNAVPERAINFASARGRMVAGYGPTGYVLGWSPRGPAVWRTEDGKRWQRLPLNLGGIKRKSRLDLDLEITAGPRGVIVVGRDNYTPPSYHGAYVWYSPHGHSFGAMTQVSSRIDKSPPTIVEDATPTGFLLSMADSKGPRLLSSSDGVHWKDTSAGFTQINNIDLVSGNTSTLVVFSHAPPPSLKPLAWYQRDGAWRRATIDPGRLPDAGVVPPNQQRVNEVHRWGAGFIAIGNTRGDEGEEIAGLVWYSADGSAWTRMPVRANGFGAAASLTDLAVSKTTAILVGYPADNSEKPLIWQTKISLNN